MFFLFVCFNHLAFTCGCQYALFFLLLKQEAWNWCVVFLKPSQQIFQWWWPIVTHFSPVFSMYNLCYFTLPTSLTLSYFECPFSLANFMFSFSFPLQLFLILSSAAALSLKEKTTIIEELGFPYCLKPETNQFPLPPNCVLTRVHTHTLSLNKCSCVQARSSLPTYMVF